jgi:hypothetical protein
MPRLQFRNARGVITMVVRHQNVRQPPSRVGQCFLDRCRFRRVDRSRGARRWVVQQHPVIVLKA